MDAVFSVHGRKAAPEDLHGATAVCVPAVFDVYRHAAVCDCCCVLLAGAAVHAWGRLVCVLTRGRARHCCSVLQAA